MNPDYRTLGSRIRFARVYRAMRVLQQPPSQTAFGEAVAKRVGRPSPYSEATVSNWERNFFEPDRMTLAAIADEAEVSKSWLAFNEGKPQAEHEER